MADNMDIEVNPTIEVEMEVDMGSAASEYNAEAWAVGERGGARNGKKRSKTERTFQS